MNDADSPLAIAVQPLTRAQQTGDARYAAQVIALLEAGRPPSGIPMPGQPTGPCIGRRLDSADWIHFVCHGEQDLSSPSEGRLQMYDGPLTVRRLARHHVQRGELAMLSGCETVRGGLELADEAITLASAIQLAGFQHVIGTLWAVGDAIAVRFADAVYCGLARDGMSAGPTAHGVHLAVWRLRERYASSRAWAPFIHVGP